MGKKCRSKGKGKEAEVGASMEQARTFSYDETRKRIVYEDDNADEFEEKPAVTMTGTTKRVTRGSSSKSKKAKIGTHIVEDEIGPSSVSEDECRGKEEENVGVAERKMRKQIVKETRNTRGKLETYQHFETRSSPSTIVEALQELKKSVTNEAQIRTLRHIGFGRLLDLEIKKQPRSLGSWLVDHFDPNKCSIEFPDGRSVDISDVDVHRCLGIPLGTENIVLKGQTENNDVLEEWRTQFQKKYACLRPSHVKKAMLECVDGGLAFVQNFLVLFDTTLVNSQQSGGVSQGLVRSIVSVDAVMNVNWCQYVVTRLVKAKVKFGAERKGSFMGPVLFLVLLYLDRVVHQGQRQVPRSIPVFEGWNDTIVSAREKSEMLNGGFGKGRIEPPMEVDVTAKALVTKEDYVADLLKAAVEMSVIMKQFVEKLNRIPNEFRQDPTTRFCYELGQTVLGRRVPASCGNVESVATQAEKLFNDPTLLSKIKKVDDAIKERDALLKERNRWHDPVDEVIADIGGQDGVLVGGQSVGMQIRVPKEEIGDDSIGGIELIENQPRP